MPISNSSSITGTANHTSDANSYIGPIDPGAEFSGAFEDVNNYVSINVFCKADREGVLFFDFSIDGIEPDRTYTTPITDITDGTCVATGPRARFFRLRFRNDGDQAANLKLATIFSPSVTEVGYAPLGSGLTSKSNSITARSLVFGQTARGIYTPLKISSDGTLSVNIASPPAEETYIFRNGEAVTSGQGLQAVLSYTPQQDFSLKYFSLFAWPTQLNTIHAMFGDIIVECPNASILIKIPLSTFNGGSYSEVIPGSLPIVPAGSELKFSCISKMEQEVTWRVNFSGIIKNFVG